MDVSKIENLVHGKSRLGFRFHTSEGVFDCETTPLSCMVLKPFATSGNVVLKKHDGVLMTHDEYTGLISPVDISDNEPQLIRILDAADVLVAVRGVYRPKYERDSATQIYPFLYKTKSSVR